MPPTASQCRRQTVVKSVVLPDSRPPHHRLGVAVVMPWLGDSRRISQISIAAGTRRVLNRREPSVRFAGQEPSSERSHSAQLRSSTWGDAITGSILHGIRLDAGTADR